MTLKGIEIKSIQGKLAGSDSVFGLKLEISGKIVIIPTHFIESVQTYYSDNN